MSNPDLPPSPQDANPYAGPAAPLEAPSPQQGPKGLGGWLILVILGLFGNLFVLAVNVFNAGSALPRRDLPSGYTPILWFEVVANSVLWLFCLLVVVLFFARKKRFPGLYIALLFGLFLMQAVDQIWAASLNIVQAEEVVGSFIRPLIALAIWGTYMLKSRRVANTFVE